MKQRWYKDATTAELKLAGAQNINVMLVQSSGFQASRTARSMSPPWIKRMLGQLPLGMG